MNSDKKEIIDFLVQQIKAYPPGTTMMLLNEHSESILMDLFDNFPISSPIMFQCTIPKQTVKNIAKYMIERRRESPHPTLVLMLDPESTASQAAYLVEAFKSYECVLYLTFSLKVPVLHSVVKGLGFGQGVRLDDDLPEDTLQSTIPLIPTETILYLSRHMQEETVAIIAQLVRPAVRVSFLAQNIPLSLANTLAMNVRAGGYLCVSQESVNVLVAQNLAKNLNDGVILYCASGNASYMTAIASSLKAGGILIFHPSISFEDVLQALRYMRPGTMVSLDYELDETQIELFVRAIQNDVGILFNKFLVSKETRDQIMAQLESKKSKATPASTQKISSVLSFFQSEEKRISDLNEAKVTRFFTEQCDPDGPFHGVLKSIMQNTAMSQYEIVQYFIDKCRGARVVYNPSLENTVKDYGFRFLVDFEDELRHLTEARQLSEEFIDSSKKTLTEKLQTLEEHMMSMDIDGLGLWALER